MHPGLMDIISKVKEKITDDSDMVWTHYGKAKELRDELDNILQAYTAGDLNSLDKLRTLFLPTATLQEHAITNGWSEEYLALAQKFDSLYLAIMN